tara:strand:- start:135 stop:416 length:282 start_codon:yes stop_codon:yes gene_type:complete
MARSIEEIKASLDTNTDDDALLTAQAEYTRAQELDEELNGYKYDRENAYPEIKEQLDKLYHDIDGGLLGEDAKTGSWYLAIKEVKDDNPKPSE